MSNHANGRVSPGDTVESSVTVENTGSIKHKFFVRAYAKDPEGRAYYDDDTAGRAVILEEGETRALDLSWTVDRNIPEGTYDFVTEGWLEADPDELTNRFNREIESTAFTVEKPTGELSVTSEPEQATISVDGEFIGKTPITEGLPIGTYDVVAIQEDYLPIQETVDITENETTAVSIDLENPAPASFEVAQLSAPSWVDKNEEFVVSAGITNTGDQPGEQEVEYRFNGSTESVETVKIEGNGSELVEFTYSAPGELGEYEHGVSTPDDSETTTIVVDAPFEVEWQPPVAGEEYTHTIGRTLPLKFKLSDPDHGVIETEQEVYLSVYGPVTDNGRGDAVERWFLGEGRDALRFDSDDDQYIANFFTREYDLDGGETYAAVVHDLGTTNVMDETTFQLEERSGNQRGQPDDQPGNQPN